MTTIMTSLSAADAAAFHKILCRKKDRDRNRDRDGIYPYKVVEITPPPRSLGVRCFPQNLQYGKSVTIEGQAYTISAVTHRYRLRKGTYEPSEKRLDVLSSGRPMTRLEKQQLQKLIKDLPEHHLSDVAELLTCPRRPEAKECDEIFVNLNKEENQTLSRIYYYISKKLSSR